jgi:hypothetical protein
MDVVALQSDHVVRAREVKAPVVLAVACCRPLGRAIDLVVRDSYSI